MNEDLHSEDVVIKSLYAISPLISFNTLAVLTFYLYVIMNMIVMSYHILLNIGCNYVHNATLKIPANIKA